MRLVSSFLFLALLAACGGASPGGAGGTGGAIAQGGSGGGSAGAGGMAEIQILAPQTAYAGKLVNVALLNVPSDAVVSWDQMPGPPAGTFTEHASSGAQWYSPDVAEPTTFELRATVGSTPYTTMV